MEEETPSAISRPPLPHPPVSDDNARPLPPPLTYIVQVPKDQTFPIPPQHHPHQSSLPNKHSPCLLFLSISLSISLPLLAAALLFMIFIRPAAPLFYIDRIVADQKFEIFMHVTNPSIGMGYLIENSVWGGVKVGYEGKRLGCGESPMLKLEAKTSRRFMLVLREESLRGLKKVVMLRLMVEAPVRAEIWGVRMWWMGMKVGCDVRVKNEGKVMEVLSQECKVSIEFW